MRTTQTRNTAKKRERRRGGQRSSDRRGRLEGGERRRLAVLGLPTFGLALAITTVSSYLPVVVSDFTGSAAVIGLLIGGEGAMALFVPLVVGVWSDQLATRFGGRLPFVLAGAPAMALALVTMGVARSLGLIAVAVTLFFFAYYVAYEPYRALYPDLFPDSVAARAQGNQAVWRGLGTIVALAGGGLLLSAGTLLPFAFSALSLAGAVGAFAVLITRSGRVRRRRHGRTRNVRAAAARIATLLRRHGALRWYLGANALWELSLAALKTFIVLYITRGLGYSLSESSLIIGVVAVLILGGALLSGKLGDRVGKLRTMRWSLWVYGVVLAIPALTSAHLALLAAVPVLAFGGGVIMSLPYALLMPLMPEEEHGSLTGLYSFSRGVGTMAGPLLAGASVQGLGGAFGATDGYGAMWIVCSGAILASIPMLARLRAASGDRRRLEQA